MKNQALFSSKDKSKKLKCRLRQFLFGALRVNISISHDIFFHNGSGVNVVLSGVSLHNKIFEFH